MNIVVLAGGYSPERDVSLSSGCLIANALLENGHRALLVDLYLGLQDVRGFEAAWEKHHRSEYRYTVPKEEPDLAALRAERGGRGEVGENVLAVCAGADVVFVGLHGASGENGRVQAMLDLWGVRYTGTGYAGSLLAMDKVLAKELMRCHGIDTPAWEKASLGVRGDVERAAQKVGLPCVVKPVGCGSSVGVSMVRTREELEAALRYAQKYEDTVLLERLVEGREFSVGVLDGHALPVIEIRPKAGFYDYANKYQPGFAEELCPASLSQRDTARIQAAAERVHEVLRLGSYSRVDFMWGEDGRFYCLEANTLPGMTPTSLLPQEAAAAGIAYPQLCQRIVELAVEAT